MGDVAGVQRFYGRWAGLYDHVARRTPGVGPVRRRAVESLGLEPGATVLDVGCGTGANAPYLREPVGPTGRVVGLDLTPAMLRRARRLADDPPGAAVHVVRGDGARPPLASADAVLGTFVVGLFEAPGEAVDRWVDLLPPGGRVALLDAAPRGRDGPLDAAFRLFVAASAPPTAKLRYEDSPADRLDGRVRAARDALADRTDVVADERACRGFLRLTVGERSG